MWNFDRLYQSFEHLISRIVMIILGAVTIYAIYAAGVEIVADLKPGTAFFSTELMQDSFGAILTVLILLEFNHSIYAAIRQRSGVIQARSIVLLTVIVVARKLILLDFKTTTIEQVGSFGAIAVALGCLYWLIGSASGRHPGAGDGA